MTRQIFLDTETSGMEVNNGCVVIEIGCVEYIDGQPTGRTYHQLLNPAHATWEMAAQEVHGHTLNSLMDKPVFAQVVDEFLDFVRGAEVLIHNAPFDVGFLNAELSRAGKPPLQHYVSGIVDTLIQAKSICPGERNNLDALCSRYNINNENRVFHGALIDADLLAQVYFVMLKGAPDFIDDLVEAEKQRPPVQHIQRSCGPMIHLTETELSNHQQYQDNLAKQTKKPLVWQQTLNKPSLKI